MSSLSPWKNAANRDLKKEEADGVVADFEIKVKVAISKVMDNVVIAIKKMAVRSIIGPARHGPSSETQKVDTI